MEVHILRNVKWSDGSVSLLRKLLVAYPMSDTAIQTFVYAVEGYAINNCAELDMPPVVIMRYVRHMARQFTYGEIA